MASTKLTSREFNQDTAKAKKAAQRGPVIITDRGRAAHVLLTIEDYERLTRGSETIVELLGMPNAEEVDFEPPRAERLHRPADLS